MKLSRTAIALYVGLVFASGVVLGVSGHRLYTLSTVSAKAPRNPEEFRKGLVAEYQRRLQLSDQQVTQLNTILDETLAQYKAAHDKLVPELQAIHTTQIDRVRAMLSPQQQTEYEKMRQERQQRQKQERKKRGGGPGRRPGRGF
jgi:hypothetical protein